MGKTKIKLVDDSQPEAETKEKKPKSEPKKELQDTLVAKLKEELGVEEEKLDIDQTSTIKPQKPSSKEEHPISKSKSRSKKYQQKLKQVDKDKFYPLSEAVDKVKKLSYSEFDGTLEIHINTVASGIHGLISLPYASGKKMRILAFGSLPSPEEYKGIVLGDQNSLDEIGKGRVNFDLVITTPEWMPQLAKVARILGPRGLMPNPKNGTIVDDLRKAIESFQAGKTEYKTEPKAAVIHLPLGKLNQPNEELAANVKTLIQTLGKTRVKKVTLSPTMGSSVKVDLTSI